MTDCDWAEKVSLLIDGELASEEARAVELHLGDCFACRLAREDFLLLRHQLSTYRPEVDLLAQRRALQNILGSDAAADTAAARPDESGRGLRARAAGLFALPRFSPALVAASALLLVALVAGLLLLRRDERPANDLADAPRPGVNANAPGGGEANPQAAAPAPTPGEAHEAKIRPKGAGAIDLAKSADAAKPRPEVAPDAALVKGPKPKGTNGTNLIDRRTTSAPGAGELARAEDDDLPLIIPPRIPFEADGSAASDAAEAAEVASAAEPVRAPDPNRLSPARHAEQAQQLLRSFRNAGAGGAADLSYERERSQALLYQNILLRREAASRGNVAVESVLGSLEPILVDIANLPERPAGEEVRSINERMKKKDIVAMLQIAARD